MRVKVTILEWIKDYCQNDFKDKEGIQLYLWWISNR